MSGGPLLAIQLWGTIAEPIPVPAIGNVAVFVCALNAVGRSIFPELCIESMDCCCVSMLLYLLLFSFAVVDTGGTFQLRVLEDCIDGCSGELMVRCCVAKTGVLELDEDCIKSP
uniref:Putative secreted peptide n=1 Tax=Anopheles braziliensis TaxID=58242 RepID=A0A2M3ZSE2_9DIPT